MNVRSATMKMRAFGLLARRVAAYTVDVGLLSGVLALVALLAQRLAPLEEPGGPAIAGRILWTFSLPAWLYFALSDAAPTGATLGKRLCRLRVSAIGGRRLRLGRALGRTALKLLPWELVHVFAFALSRDPASFSGVQRAGLIGANVLIVVYLGVAVATRGRRSLHDLVVGTMVQAAPLREEQPGPRW